MMRVIIRNNGIFKIALISRTLFRGSVWNKGYPSRFAYFSIVLLFIFAAPVVYTVAQIDASTFGFDPNAKRFHFEVGCNEFKEKTSSLGARIMIDSKTVNNGVHNNKNSFDIAQSYYITEGDKGVDFYRNNCIASPAANTTTTIIRAPTIELISGSEFIVGYSQEHYEPTTVSLYPNGITDKSILLGREINKVEDFEGSEFIHEENRFLFAVPHVEGVFTVVLFEDITDESEALHIIRNVKIVNGK
jgi:hypothetical protein